MGEEGGMGEERVGWERRVGWDSKCEQSTCVLGSRSRAPDRDLWRWPGMCF